MGGWGGSAQRNHVDAEWPQLPNLMGICPSGGTPLTSGSRKSCSFSPSCRWQHDGHKRAGQRDWASATAPPGTPTRQVTARCAPTSPASLTTTSLTTSAFRSSSSSGDRACTQPQQHECACVCHRRPWRRRRPSPTRPPHAAPPTPTSKEGAADFFGALAFGGGGGGTSCARAFEDGACVHRSAGAAPNRRAAPGQAPRSRSRGTHGHLNPTHPPRPPRRGR